MNQKFLAKIAFVSLLVLAFCSCSKKTEEIESWTSESEFLRLVTSQVAPTFPADAAARQEGGVAVALVTLDKSGTIAAIEMLDSPSPSISQAVEAAIKQWRFISAPVANGKVLKGRVTYYFAYPDGRPTVYEASKAPDYAKLKSIIPAQGLAPR